MLEPISDTFDLVVKPPFGPEDLQTVEWFATFAGSNPAFSRISEMWYVRNPQKRYLTIIQCPLSELENALSNTPHSGLSSYVEKRLTAYNIRSASVTISYMAQFNNGDRLLSFYVTAWIGE